MSGLAALSDPLLRLRACVCARACFPLPTAAKVQAQVGVTTKGFSVRSPAQLLRLYRGVLPPLLTTGAMRSLYFGLYESVRPETARLSGRHRDSLPVIFLAGGATGVLTAPVTAPMQRQKLVQQLQMNTSIVETLKRLVANGGVISLFRGLGLHCALEGIGSGAYLVAYAAAKAVLCAQPVSTSSGSGSAPPPPDSLLRRVLCGMTAGIAGWLSIYPLDVLRSRIMSAVPPSIAAPDAAADGASRALAPRSNLYSMVSDAMRETYANGGMRGFYRGLGFTLLRAAPVAGVVLPVYDASRAWLLQNTEP